VACDLLASDFIPESSSRESPFGLQVLALGQAVAFGGSSTAQPIILLVKVAFQGRVWVGPRPEIMQLLVDLLCRLAGRLSKQRVRARNDRCL
jgi:hypothetical protein